MSSKLLIKLDKICPPTRESLSHLLLRNNSYSDAPFVRVLHNALPQTKATLGSNYCDVTVHLDARTNMAIAIAALDNLGRGAAGQAVQNMNLMFGLLETTGLRFPALFP